MNLHNILNFPTALAYRRLCKAMRKDPGYAHAWYCNIVMPIYDHSEGKLTIHECNEIGLKLMKHLFAVEHKEPHTTFGQPKTKGTKC